MVRIEILGPLRVVAGDGRDVTPRGMQQRRALTALAAAAPAPVSVHVLEDLLWPAGAPSTNALQATISKLRRVVSPASIEGDGRSYLLVGADSDLAELDLALSAAEWDRVESLAAGEPLADLDGHSFAAPIAARVGAAVRAARSRRLEALVDGPDPGSAIVELEELVTLEPFDEGWWAKLMTAHARCGRQADALQIYQRARSVLSEQLGLEPGPALRQVEAQIFAQEITPVPSSSPASSSPASSSPASSSPASSSPASSSPASSSAAVRRALPVPSRVASFVGRRRELAELTTSVAAHRLVTLVGPGGAGKTTTTLELCERLGRDVAFAQLAGAGDRDAVIRTVARAIGLPDTDQTSLAGPAEHLDGVVRVRDALVNRSLTLVLDNCEHVIEVAAELADEVLTGCPAVSVIATSRESLGVPGEHVYPLPPLQNEEAVALFVERASDHGIVLGSEFDPTLGPTLDPTLDASVEMAIASVCERLDGLPLAIELAAARLRTMSVDELHEGLDDRFALLSSGPRLAAPRQQTLRAVVDWSHDLLDPVERVVFRRLAAFVGGAGADGARAVCSGSSPDGVEVDPSDVPSVFDRLVDKSLVRVERWARGIRFSMLQTLLDYATEQLADSGEREIVLIRHAQFVADDVEPALLGLIGREQPEWFVRVREERGNLDGALETALAVGDAQLALELVVPIGWYYYMAGEMERGVDSISGALACQGPTEPRDRALALAFYGWLLSNGPDLESARAATTEALALVADLDDPWVRDLVVNIDVMARFFSGHLDSVESCRPSLDRIIEHSDDPWIAAITRVVKGEIAQHQGRADEAERMFGEAAAQFDAVGDRFAYALTITEASELAEMVGDYDHAAELLARGIELAAEVGFSGHPLAMRARLGNVEILRGDLELAEFHHRALIDDAATLGVPWLQAMARLGLSTIARRRGDFDDARHQLDLAWGLPRSRSVPYMRSIIQVARGYLADQQGEADHALAHQNDGFVTAMQLRTPRGMAYSFEGMAGALALSADPDHRLLAAELLGAADALRRASGGPLPPAERYDVGRAEERARAALGEAAFERAFLLGAVADVDALARRVDALQPHALTV